MDDNDDDDDDGADIFKLSLLPASAEETFHIVFKQLVVTYVSKTMTILVD